MGFASLYPSYTLRAGPGPLNCKPVAVVYYAGHGIELDGTNYLIPVCARAITPSARRNFVCGVPNPGNRTRSLATLHVVSRELRFLAPGATHFAVDGHGRFVRCKVPSG